MEEGTRLISTIGDSWINEIDQSPAIPYADKSDAVPGGGQDMSRSYASGRIREPSIDVHPNARPFVINSLTNYDNPPTDNKATVGGDPEFQPNSRIREADKIPNRHPQLRARRSTQKKGHGSNKRICCGGGVRLRRFPISDIAYRPPPL